MTVLLISWTLWVISGNYEARQVYDNDQQWRALSGHATQSDCARQAKHVVRGMEESYKKSAAKQVTVSGPTGTFDTPGDFLISAIFWLPGGQERDAKARAEMKAKGQSSYRCDGCQQWPWARYKCWPSDVNLNEILPRRND